MTEKRTAAATAARRAKAAERREDEIAWLLNKGRIREIVEGIVRGVIGEQRPSVHEKMRNVARSTAAEVFSGRERTMTGAVIGEVEKRIGEMVDERVNAEAIYNVHQEKFWDMATNAAWRVVNSRVPSLVGEHGDTPHDEDCWHSFREVVERVIADSPALANRLREASNGCAPFLEVKPMPPGTRGVQPDFEDMGEHGWTTRPPITRSGHTPGEPVSIDGARTMRTLTHEEYERVWHMRRFPPPQAYTRDPRGWDVEVSEWIASVHPEDRLKRLNVLDWVGRRLREAQNLIARERIMMRREREEGALDQGVSVAIHTNDGEGS